MYVASDSAPVAKVSQMLAVVGDEAAVEHTLSVPTCKYSRIYSHKSTNIDAVGV